VLEDVPPGALAVGVPARIIPRTKNEVPITEKVAEDPEPSPHEISKSVGIVIIGRNEGERLQRCLASVASLGCPIVYVDSGSIDGSIARAQSFGAELLELDKSQPFTAARGRNAGWRRLIELRPDVEFVQFIDGDCELCDGWLPAAVGFARKHADVAVICGRRHEIDPDLNIYHRWTDMEWDTPVGEAAYCGGDALIRRATLEHTGGYRDDLIAGEEPELCVRIRSVGKRVWRIDHDMTRHDIAMNTFGQWWNRSVRSGHAYAEGAALHGSSPARHWVKESRSIWIWGAALPIAAILLAWPTDGISLVISAIAYLALFAKILLNSALERACNMASAASFAGMCVAMKWPQAIGQMTYWINRWRRTPAPIIEYNKDSPQQESNTHDANKFART
jgi:glycosyltransferase involved in cell wall biosynthesis